MTSRMSRVAPSNRSRSAQALLACAVSSLMATSSIAQQYDWNNANGGSYITPSNWSPIGPPSLSGTARFNLNTGYTVTFTTSPTVNAISVNNGSVTWQMGGNTYTAPNTTNSGIGSTLRIRSGTFQPGGLSVGGSSAANPANVYLLQNSTMTIGSGGFSVGVGDFGNVYIQELSTFTSSGFNFVGGVNGGVGLVNIDGTGSSWTVLSTLQIGIEGPGGGTVNVLNGATLTANAIDVGGATGSSGTLTVGGSGSTVTVGGTANIGGPSAGSPALLGAFNLAAGATVLFNGTTNLRSTARVNMSGGLLNLNTLNISPGASVNWTAGNVNFNNASSINSSVLDLFLGGTHTLGANRTLSGSSGSMTLDTSLAVNGGTLSAPVINVNAPLSIGAFGTVTASDTVNLGVGQSVQIENFGVLGSTNPIFNNGALVELHGSLAKVTGFFFNIGTVQGTGRFAGGLNNAVGGTIRAGAGDHIIIDSAGLTNNGNIELSGGVVEYSKVLSNLGGAMISGHGEFRGSTANPGSLGLSNGGVLAFSAGNTDIHGDVNNVSAGKIVTAGGGVLTFYDDVIHNGSEIRTASGARTVFFGAETGAGPFTGTGTVEFQGDLRPGNSPAVVTFDGSVEFGPGATTYIEVGGLNPGTEHDQLSISGSALLDGDVRVKFINNNGIPKLFPNQQITAMRFGSHTGDVNIINDTGFAGLILTKILTPNFLIIQGEALLVGDTDLNGVIDGADYARVDSTFNNEAIVGNISGWYNGDFDFNGKVDGADYALIDASFNSQGAAPASVPEPMLGGAATLMINALIIARPSRRRRA